MTADATRPESMAAEDKGSGSLLRHEHRQQGQYNVIQMDPDLHYTLLEGSSRYGFSSRRK